MSNSPQRYLAAKKWITSALETSKYKIIPISGDAGFRQYSRIYLGKTKTYIFVDAIPTKNENDKFILNSKIFESARTPNILCYEPKHGFLLIEDFGNQTMLSKLTNKNVIKYYKKAINKLIELQSLTSPKILTKYSKSILLREINLFPEWYRKEYLKTPLSSKEKIKWNNISKNIINSCLVQPNVFVHRDYHSRNIMILKNMKLGLIDYQDALCGPITYDLVSLLKDAYFKIDSKIIEKLLKYYYKQASSKLLLKIPFPDFKKYFDLMGLQRHLKVLGIFARLSIRDQKHDYLNSIPLVKDYIKETILKYKELNQLEQIIFPTTVYPFIFAAGLGSRLRPITNTIPKPLVPVKNTKSLLELNIDRLIEYKFSKVAICYSYKYGMFLKLKKKYKNKINIILIKDSSVSGHGGVLLQNLSKFISTKYVLGINGDTLLETDLNNFISQNKSGDFVFATSEKIKRPPKSLICIKNNLIGIKNKDKDYFYRKTKINKDKLIYKNNLGLYLISVEALNSLPKISHHISFFDKDGIVSRLIKLNKTVLSQNISTNYYYSINNIEDLTNLRKIFNQK